MSIPSRSLATFISPLLSSTEISGLSDLLIFQQFSAPVAALLAYDFILTFSDEIDLMWKRGRNLLSFIFFLNRYLPFVGVVIALTQQFTSQPTNPQVTCKAFFSIDGWFSIVGVNVADGILILRTYAIWGTDRRVGLGLLALMLPTFVPEAFYMTKLISSLTFIRSPSPSAFPGCFSISADSTSTGIAYSILLAFETVLFAVTLFKLLRKPRRTATNSVQEYMCYTQDTPPR